jgi:hypothetical protein
MKIDIKNDKETNLRICPEADLIGKEVDRRALF